MVAKETRKADWRKNQAYIGCEAEVRLRDMETHQEAAESDAVKGQRDKTEGTGPGWLQRICDVTHVGGVCARCHILVSPRACLFGLQSGSSGALDFSTS